MTLEGVTPLGQISQVELSLVPSAAIAAHPRIVLSGIAHEVFMSQWDKGTLALYTEFHVLFLDRSNHVLAHFKLSQGGREGTLVDAKILYAAALLCGACNIILAHNVPSGRLVASESVKRLSQRLLDAGKLLDIAFFDHLLISPNGVDYLSMLDEGFVQSTPSINSTPLKS